MQTWLLTGMTQSEPAFWFLCGFAMLTVGCSPGASRPSSVVLVLRMVGHHRRLCLAATMYSFYLQGIVSGLLPCILSISRALCQGCYKVFFSQLSHWILVWRLEVKMSSRDHRAQGLVLFCFCFLLVYFTVSLSRQFTPQKKSLVSFWQSLLPFMSEVASYRWLLKVHCFAYICDFIFWPKQLVVYFYTIRETFIFLRSEDNFRVFLLISEFKSLDIKYRIRYFIV